MKVNKQQLQPGIVIDQRYTVIRAIGQGGMAYVYRALDETTGEEVALKIMRDELSDDPEFIKRFATEARAAASLDHPNIVRVLDYGQDGDIRYIIQEFVEGRTIKDMVREQGALDWRLAVPLVIQITLALEHAHRRGVIHRDIKLQNILVTPDMVAKVTDFGIARASSANTITLTGGVAFGSVHYFSPEQARGGMVTARSDLYSLGISLYEMVTGELPFDGESSVAIAIKHLQEMPPLPSRIRPGLPPALDQIILKAIQKNPERRYNSARDFADELDAFMIDPDGVYGIIPQASHRYDPGTSALGLKKQESNYHKIKDIERTITKRRHSRYRDTALIVTVVSIAVILVIVIGAVLIKKLGESVANTDDTTFLLEDYRGQDYQGVKRSLEDHGLTVEIIFREDDEKAVDVIIGQEPGPNTRVKVGGTPVKLTVSSGKDTIDLPDYSGRTLLEARTELVQVLKLQVTEVREFSDTVPKDIVIKMDPLGNQKVPKGTPVTLYISNGRQNIQMPNLVGKTWSAALADLERNNLKLGSRAAIPAITLMSVNALLFRRTSVPIRKSQPEWRSALSTARAVTIMPIRIRQQSRKHTICRIYSDIRSQMCPVFSVK